jgi:hypothetical protein
MKKKYAFGLIALIFVVLFSEFFYAQSVEGTQLVINKDGSVSRRDHGSCSNNRDTCISGCKEPKEREPRERPEGPRPKGPVSTSTTPTTLPPAVVATTTPTGVAANVGCETNQDCTAGLICCANDCRDTSTGVCKDLNGDEIPDWVPYSSIIAGSILNRIFFNWLPM